MHLRRHMHLRRLACPRPALRQAALGCHRREQQPGRLRQSRGEVVLNRARDKVQARELGEPRTVRWHIDKHTGQQQLPDPRLQYLEARLRHLRLRLRQAPRTNAAPQELRMCGIPPRLRRVEAAEGNRLTLKCGTGSELDPPRSPPCLLGVAAQPDPIRRPTLPRSRPRRGSPCALRLRLSCCCCAGP